MKFRPCIDLHAGKVKQIVGSSLRDGDDASLQTNFETEKSPADFALLYRDAQLPGGHVIMLGSGNEDAAKQALGAYPGGMHVGGGITTQNAGEFLDAGASHVIVTSFVFREGQIDAGRLAALVGAVGKDKLVLDLSCKFKDGDYFVVTDRWQNYTETRICKETLAQLAESCDEFLVHAADVEGKQGGIDKTLVEILANQSPIPTTYAGGVHSFDDLESMLTSGSGRIDVTIGSALDLFGGKMRFEGVVRWFEEGP